LTSFLKEGMYVETAFLFRAPHFALSFCIINTFLMKKPVFLMKCDETIT
jgi:hypothetical protein